MSDQAKQNEGNDDGIAEAVEQAAGAVGFRVMTGDELAALVAVGAEAQSRRDEQARAEGRIFLDEERDGEVIAGWRAEAKEMTADRLPAFVAKLIDDYHHDYGTICYAIAAAGIAAANAVESSPQGGITGFQAGAVMWELVKGWGTFPEGVPLRMLDYSNLLFPQYERSFRSISPETWAWAQERAAQLLAEAGDEAHGAVSDHWRRIVAGEVPFGLEVEQ